MAAGYLSPFAELLVGTNQRYRLLFHDTHRRSVTDSDSLAAYALPYYDGGLAFGQVITDLYVERGWAARRAAELERYARSLVQCPV